MQCVTIMGYHMAFFSRLWRIPWIALTVEKTVWTLNTSQAGLQTGEKICFQQLNCRLKFILNSLIGSFPHFCVTSPLTKQESWVSKTKGEEEMLNSWQLFIWWAGKENPMTIRGGIWILYSWSIAVSILELTFRKENWKRTSATFGTFISFSCTSTIYWCTAWWRSAWVESKQFFKKSLVV